MSDTGDSTTKITIDATVTGTGEVTGLSAGVSSLAKHLADLSASAKKVFDTQASLNKALEQTKRNTGVVSNSLNEYRRNLHLIKVTTDETTRSINELNAAQARASTAGALPPAVLASYQQTRKHLNGMNDSVQGLTAVMKSNAIEQFASRMKVAGQTAQRSAYYMTAATMPFVLALKSAFFSFTKLEQEQVRLKKLIGDNFTGMADGARLLEVELTKINTDLDQITRKFGTSRVLVQSLAGDFAELGVSSDAVARLTEFTTAAEKLGNLDISASQNFIQSLYQNVVRVRREAAQKQGIVFDISNVDEMNAVLDEVQGQLALFNLIENKTALSLKDIADAFPEVSAAATTFGLSMTETAALLTPMVAAGFQVGASANSIKVSLQRLVAMTKQNTGIIQELNQTLGPDFNMAADVGMRSIQRLIDGYDKLKEAKGEQGAQEFFARLFGVRQGPRMEVALQQMAAFQTALRQTGSAESIIAKRLETNVNSRLQKAGMETISIKKVIDLTDLHRAAIEKANGQYTDRAKVIQQAGAETNEMLKKEFLGTSDYLAKVGTESGREIFMQAIGGVEEANRIMEAELSMAIKTTATNFNRLRESLMSISRQFVPVIGDVIKAILPIIQKIEDFVKNLSPATKKIIGAILFLVALIPQIKLFTAIFKMLFGGTVSFFHKIVLGSNSAIKKLSGVASKIITIQELVDNPRAVRGFNKVTQYGDNVLLEQDKRSPNYRSSLFGRRRMMPDPSAIRLSQPIQELLNNRLTATATSPTDPKFVKSVVDKTAKTGLTDTTSFVKSLLGWTDEGKKAAKATAKTAEAAVKAVDKTSSAAAEKIVKGLKGSVFYNNTFLGNKFGGNAAGPGGSGSGSRTPKTPGSGGTPAPGAPAPGAPAPGAPAPGAPAPRTPRAPRARPVIPLVPSKGVTFADLAKLPKSAPTGSAGAQVASILAAIAAGIAGMGGASTAPSAPAPGAPAPGAPAPKTTRVRRTPKINFGTYKGAILASIADVVKNNENIIQQLSQGTQSLGEAVSTNVKKASKGATKAPRAPPQKSLAKISYKEIRTFFDNAKVAIPQEFEFIRTLSREIEVTERTKNNFFNELKKQFAKNPQNPFGKIIRRGDKSQFQIFNRGRNITKDSPYLQIFKNIFRDAANQDIKGLERSLQNAIAGIAKDLIVKGDGGSKSGRPVVSQRAQRALQVAKNKLRAERIARLVDEGLRSDKLKMPPKDVELFYRSQDPQITGSTMGRRGLLNLQSNDEVLRNKAVSQDTGGPFNQKNFREILTKRVSRLGGTSKDASARVLYDLLLEENVQNIMSATDAAVKKQIDEEVRNILSTRSLGGLDANELKIERQKATSRAIRRLAARRTDIGQLNPLSEKFIEEKEQSLLTNKKLVKSLQATYGAQDTGDKDLLKTLSKMQAEYSPEKISKRKKAVEAYRRAGFQILKTEQAAELAANNMAQAAAKTEQAAQQAAARQSRVLKSTLLPRGPVAPTPASVTPMMGGLPSMDPYPKEVGGRAGLKIPQIISQRVAFAKKGSGAVVASAIKTYEDLVKETIEKISKQLPSSLGAHKKMLINEISNALLKTQPLGAGKASQQALKLLQMPIDPITIRRVETALAAITNTIIQDYNSALTQGATYATMEGQKVTRQAGKTAISMFKGALSKFVQNGDNLSKVLQAVVVDMIAASSVGINDLEQKGVLKAGNKAPKVKAALLGEDGLISRLTRARGGEKGLLAPAISYDSESKPSTSPSVKTNTAAVDENTVATQASTTATTANAEAESLNTNATKGNTTATTTNTKAQVEGGVAEKEQTVASKAKTAKTLESLKATTYDAKITEMLGAAKVKQLASIDAQIASLTAEQISSEAGQALIAQRNEVTTKLNSLEEAQAKVISAKAGAEAAGRKRTTLLNEAQANLKKKLDNARDETKKLAEKAKALADSMKKGSEPAPKKPSKAVPAVVPTDPAPEKPSRTPRSPKTIVTPKGRGAAVAAAAAGSGMGDVIKKLDEVAISFDKSLANFFKGPNFFQGPNIFQGKIISADKLKITMTDRARDASRLAKARASLIPSDDPLVERAKARAKFLELKKKMEAEGGAPLSLESRERLAKSVGYTLPTAHAPVAPVGPVTTAVTSAVSVTKTATSKITDLIKLGISKGFEGGSKLGAKVIERMAKNKALAKIIQILSTPVTKLGVDAMSEVVLAMGKIFGKTVATTAATGKLASAYKFLTKVSEYAGKNLKAGLVESIFLMKMLGTAIRQDVGAALAQLMASLANSRVIKIWSFLLFTGMNKFYKILKTTLVSMSLFSSHGARMAAVTTSLEAVSKMRAAAGLSSTIPLIQELIIRITSYLGLVRGLRGAFQALAKTMVSVLAVGIK